MALTVKFELPTGESGMIVQRLREKVQSARQELVRSSMTTILTDISDNTPFETGAARRGWQEEMTRLQSSPPTSLSAESSVQSATNAIEHVVYLEYGTSRMPPRHIVRSGIERLRAALPSLFRLPG